MEAPRLNCKFTYSTRIRSVGGVTAGIQRNQSLESSYIFFVSFQSFVFLSSIFLLFQIYFLVEIQALVAKIAKFKRIPFQI